MFWNRPRKDRPANKRTDPVRTETGAADTPTVGFSAPQPPHIKFTAEHARLQARLSKARAFEAQLQQSFTPGAAAPKPPASAMAIETQMARMVARQPGGKLPKRKKTGFLFGR